ncbi:hypothetical protein SDC9_189464 [bioreactor metagenome]|uniref:Uncharacterized protein n=1 Tax=bioreactor metagenome TaxID=1076179 RepID=A0A645HUP0_9ZZZZ
MHAAELVRPGCSARKRRYADTRGVRGEYRVFVDDLIELCEFLAFDGQIFDDGLNNQIGVGCGFISRYGYDSCERIVISSLGDLVFGEHAVEVCGDNAALTFALGFAAGIHIYVVPAHDKRLNDA